MKSISLILSVAALYSLSTAADAQEKNYSLWPKRPPEIEQARRLISEQKMEDAIVLLHRHIKTSGIVGREARKLTGAINVRRYLSRFHPEATIYQVSAGDTLTKIAAKTSCATELIILLNGLVNPSALKAGQKLVVVKMQLQAKIDVRLQELTVWDGDNLVATYDVKTEKLPKRDRNLETRVEARDGYIDGGILPIHAVQFLASERVIRLENGVSLTGAQSIAGAVVQMQPADVNELALLLSKGAVVEFVYQDD